MHFNFRNYLTMLRLAFQQRNPRSRRLALLSTLVVIPIVATIHAIGFLLDNLLFPGLHRQKVTAPVFLIGHARSGTTLMHHLMASDSERFSCFLAYEMFFPSLLEKKLIRLLGHIDRRLLGGRIERLLVAQEDEILAEGRDMHQTGLFSPEEDDFVLTFSCASGFWMVLFPYMRELNFYDVDQQPDRQRKRLMGFYRDCVRRQLQLNGSGKTHISKNPTFCGRVESLIQEFPDARFVIMLRDPREAIPSLLKMMKKTWRGLGWDEARIHESLEMLTKYSIHSYHYPLEVLEQHPETKWTVVHYRELVAGPKRTVEDVYRALDLDMTPAHAALLDEQEKRSREHETSHSYDLEEFGIDSKVLKEQLAPLFERFGWDRDAPPPS
jgi:hypothetical protein